MLTLEKCKRFKEAAFDLSISMDLRGGGLCYALSSLEDDSSYPIMAVLFSSSAMYMDPPGEFTELRKNVLALILAMSAKDIYDIVTQHKRPVF